MKRATLHISQRRCRGGCLPEDRYSTSDEWLSTSVHLPVSLMTSKATDTLTRPLVSWIIAVKCRRPQPSEREGGNGWRQLRVDSVAGQYLAPSR